MKLTKKSEVNKKEGDIIEVFEAELIDDKAVELKKTDLNLREKPESSAYTFGKIVGYVGSFFLGMLRNKNTFGSNERIEGKGMRRGHKGKRRGRNR